MLKPAVGWRPALAPSHATCGQGAASVAFFTGKKMTVYQKIVQGEFHDHSLIAKRLYSLLCQHFQPTQELQLLDLGCGDASFAASILSQGDPPLSLSSYTGVDLSATSLQLAAQQPLPLPGDGHTSRRLVEQDMLGFLRAWQDGQHAQQEEAQQQLGQEGGRQEGNSKNPKGHQDSVALKAISPSPTSPTSAAPSQGNIKSPSDPGAPRGPYDVVLCALSVHHLAQHAKLELLRCARCAVAPGGCLLLMDVFRKEGESREAYMERAHDYFFGEEARAVLSPEESKEVWAHVTVFDFPETESDYRQMAAEAGFTRCQLLHSCRREWTKVVALWRD